MLQEWQEADQRKKEEREAGEYKMEGKLENKMNAALRGAGTSLLFVIMGELIGSRALTAVGAGGVTASAGVVAYYGLKDMIAKYQQTR